MYEKYFYCNVFSFLDVIIETFFSFLFLLQASELSFSYCVTQATGFAVAGDWDFVDQPMNTYRTVFLIHKRHWKDILKQLNS